MIERPPGNEAGPVHARKNDEQDSKEPQGDMVAIHDDSGYSVSSSEHQSMLQDNPASYDAEQ